MHRSTYALVEHHHKGVDAVDASNGELVCQETRIFVIPSATMYSEHRQIRALGTKFIEIDSFARVGPLSCAPPRLRGVIRGVERAFVT
jgi:hypothetical protein